MKKYSGIFIILVVVFVMGVAGVQMVREPSAAVNEEGTLIGMLITPEYLDLFDFESYMNDNIDQLVDGGEVMIDNTAAYGGRLYATFAESSSELSGEEVLNTDFHFEGVDGVGFYGVQDPDTEYSNNYIMCGDDEACDLKLAYNVTDDSNATSLKGTIYVSPGEDEAVYYVNPVFRLEDGSIYATSGSGFAVDGNLTEGSIYSTKFSNTVTVTEDGKKKEEIFEVEVSMSVLFPPTKIRVLQMDEQNAIVAATEYLPEELPESFDTEGNTSYLILEEIKVNSEGETEMNRTIYDKGEEELTTYTRGDHNFCVKHSIKLNWK